MLQHKEKQKRELLKELRIAAQSNARAQSASPRKWASKARASAAESQDLPAGGVDRPTEDASSGTPASPSSARRRRTMPGTAVAEESDGDAGSLPSHPSQVEDEDGSIGDRAFTEPVMPTMADVSEADIDMSECVSKILEGLRGDAFSIARDIGLNRLLQPDGIDHLIEQIRQQAFPLQSEEASELFRQGQLLSGPLAKQSGEPMLSYIARRKRWWSTLCELDPDIRLSEAMRANLLVELSGLSRQEQLMVKTAARSQTTDEFARVLVQHHSVVHMKELLLTEKERPNTQRTGYRPWSDRQQHQTPKFGYMGNGYEEFDVAEPDQGTIPEEDLQEAAYPALGSLPDDESWIDDEEVAMQLNAYTAVSEEIGADDIDEDYAEAVQLAYAATNTLSTAKGKGKGKGKDKGGKGKSGGKLVKSNLTIADRKAKLQELKSKSRCLRCGVVGHWAGDAECRFKGNAKGAAGKPSATPAQPGGAPKPAPPKPQAYMAVEESDDDEVVILSNSGSQAHGYMAMKSSSTKTGKGSGVLAPRMRRSEASATMRDSPPPGSSTLFTFGQHRGLTYERVVHTYPGYVLWGQREKCPSKNLADFLAWVHEYYVVTDSEPIEVTRRERPLSETPVPVLEQPAAPSTGGPAFYVTCRGGCKEFSKSGSNAYIDMRTCKKCGAVTKTKKEKPVIDQATCLHGVTERTGSSRKTSRLRCKLCGMLLDEQPQDERKKRSEIAATVQESNTLDFDLLRSIASRTSEDLPVEVVVPAIDQFRETVEGHFATESSITRGDLIAYLQEALEDQLPQESHNTSWEIASASAGGRSRSTRHGYVALMSGNAEGVTDTHPALEPLPVVDIYQSSGVYAVLDEGCNSTVHGTEWISNAAKKLSNLGYSTRFSSNAARTFKGLSGETETLGGRHIPFSIMGLDGESRVPGVLESHEIKGTAPLLLSLYAQAQLGISKDLRTNLYGVRLPSSDRLIPIQMYVTRDSGLLCINLTDGLLLPKQPKLLRSYKIPDPPVSLNVRVAAADRGSGPLHVHHDSLEGNIDNRGKDFSPTLAKTLARIGVGKQLGYMTVDQGTSEDQAAEDPTSVRGRPSAMGSRPGDDNESLEPSTYVRPSIITSEGRAKAHRGLQAMLREYDEACTAAGITPEGGNAAGAARSCAPPATIHIPDAGFSPALLPPRDGTSPADMVVDVFTHGYDWNATVQRIRNKWSSRALFDHFEALNTSPITVGRNRSSWTCIFLDMTHIPDARMDDDADQALKHRLQEQQRANTKHVGTHPNILNELCMHTEFIEHCRYILNVVVDAIHCGVQAINLTVVCKSNRHRSVGAGYLLGELCRYVKGTAVSITHMESAKTFPRMPFHSCKGRCTDCTHASLELWVDVQDILDGFVRKCRAVGVVDSYCVLVAEPGTARAAGIETYAERFHRECQEMEDEEQEAAAAAAAGPAAPSAGMASSPGPAPMDVDDEDSFVVPAELEGWDPIDLPPKPGETAHQAASRMELKGRRHTNYVAKWGDPESLTAIMNRATNRNTTVEFTSNPPPGAASTAPPTAGEGTSKTPSYSAPTAKVHYDAGGSGFNAGRDSLPLAPSGVPSKVPPASARPKGPPTGPVFKPPPAELMQQQAPIAPVIRPAVPPIPAGAPPPPTGPPTKAPAVDANKELIGKLRAEKEVLLAENGRLSRALRDTEEELAETRRQLRDAQLDLEESSRRAYRAERQLDDLRARRSRSRRRSYSPRDRRGDYRDRRDDPEERRYRRDDSRDIDFRRMDSRSRVRERSARADSSSHYNKIGRTARWGRDIAPAARPRSPSPPPPRYPPPPEEPPMPPPAAPPADASRGPGARATGSNEGPRGTATQPFISVYDQDDDEPWDTPGPPRSADAAGVGSVPTGGGFGTARIPPEPPRPRPTLRPGFTTSVGGGKGSGKSGDGGHRPTSYYDLPDRENPHRPLSGREARDYFRTWTPSEWKEFRRLYPRPPGQGRIIHIDEEMRSIEIAGIDRTGDVGLGWNRSINFGVFPDGILTELYNILGQKETPAMWIGPYSPTQFRAGDRRHHQLCEKHDLKVTCITPHTSPSYAPVGKPKDINPIGHLYSHNDVENRDTVSWCYEGTVYPYGMTASSTPGEAGEAERSCPSAPTDEDAEVYIVLWQYPLAFASDTAPMDLTDREELSRALEDNPDSIAPRGYMAVRAGGPGPGLRGGVQIVDPEGDFTKAGFEDEISPNYNVRGFPDPRNLRKLSGSQRKRVLQGLHELVAADEVLKSLCYNATLANSEHLMPFDEITSAQAVSGAIAARAAGPPGLVVVRSSSPTEDLCLELECLSEMIGVHIVLVGRYGSSTLETVAELRGDLSISGIGPKISEVLPVLVAWSESYGWTPRCFEDTKHVDFWHTCEQISEGLYLDSFTRYCFTGDQDTDPEDEELISDVEMAKASNEVDEGKGAYTPAEREQLILESMAFPGAPATEAERRAAWRALPQRVRVAIRRLHKAFGHLPGAVLTQVLKQARASPQFIQAAKLHRCKACLDTAPVPRHHPVSSDSLYPREFNNTVGLDCLEVKDSQGNRYTAVNIVDVGTSFQQVVIVKAGGGNPSARQCVKAFMERWTSWAGFPLTVVTDRGTHFKGDFSHFLATHGINHRNAPLESPQTIGKVERHGGILKAMLRKTVQETLPSNIEEIETVLTECVTAKNELARHQGFSPAQHVLGKQPRMPGSITDESESFGTFQARYDETSPFYLRHRARAEAKRAFIHLDTSRKVAKALQRNAAPIDAEYSVGDLVIYRRDNVPGTTATVWSTVSRVIGREAENAYWLLHENVPVLVNARKMRPADEIEVAAHRVLTGESVLPEAIINGPEQRYLDERTADPVTAPATPRPQAVAAPSTPVPVPSTPVPVPSTPVPAPDTPTGPRRSGTSMPGTSSRVLAKDKTGEETRSRSPQPRGNVAIFHGDLEPSPAEDPVEELASALLNDSVYTPDACSLLLQLYTKYQHGVYRRPLFGQEGHGVLAATLGVYRHGGIVGVSGETWSRPRMTHYLNMFLYTHCHAAGYETPAWTSLQITSLGAGPHRDTSNKPGTFNYTISVGEFTGGELWVENPLGQVSAQVQGARMKGDAYITKGVVHRFNPKQIHLVMPHQGVRYSVSGFTMSDMSKLTQQDLDFLARTGFPSYAETAVPEVSMVADAPEPTTHTPEQVVWETSPEERSQEDATAYMASLIDYHKSPVATQLGLDKAMETEWQKYVEFNAVVPCTREEMTELTQAGHVCIPTKWVLTDKNEHLSGTPGYTPKWKARLVACGNFEHMHGEDIRADSPTAEQEGIALICSWAVSLGLRLKAADITNAYFQGKPLERLLILRVPKHPKGVPDPEIQRAGFMIARVPVYGTTDAGRNLYLRIKESSRELGLKVSRVLSALYFLTDKEGNLCAALCTHVDDFLWAARGPGEEVMQRLLDRFKIGRVETDKFRFCGREYIQHVDGTIEINCRDNTRAIRPIELRKDEKGTTPVSNAQRTMLRSVIGSLAWVARATRPDLAYRVNALQQRVTTATIETLREANRVVALALNDPDRSIVYRAQLPWQPGKLAVVTFCDASFAAEQGHKSQRGRLHYLTSHEAASNPDAKTHPMHLISFSSSTMKRVCRATLQCEAYSLQHANEHGDRLRASVLELLGQLPAQGEWEEVARRSLLHVQYTDCRSLSDHLLSPVPKQVEDKRLAIELAGLRQALWEGDELSHQAFAPFGDVLRWIPTHLQLADCLTKSMKPHLLNGVVASNAVTVLADAPTVVTVPAVEERSQREEPPAPARLRHRSEDTSELPGEAAE